MRNSDWMKAVWVRISLLSLVLACLAGCATEPSALTGKTTSFGYTWRQELALGKQSDGQIVEQMGLYQNDALAEYVREIGEKVLAKSDLRGPDALEMYRDTEFTFRVLDSDVVNAFALPGGYVYVTRGLLAHLNNEAQLAVVLGHEITHVAGRHASRQALKQQWGQIGLVAGAVLGEQLMENKQMANDLLNMGGQVFQLMTLKYGRDAERESDFYGVQYAEKAGYDAAEGAEFFVSLSRISSKAGQSIPTWMSSHPDPGERELTIRRLSREWDSEYPGGVLNEERFLDMVDGLAVGTDPRQGFVERGTFYHPGLAFQFDVPSGWRVQNQSSAVYALDPGGKGVVVFQLAQERDLGQAAQNFASKNGINVVGTRRMNVDQRNGLVVEGTVQSGDQLMVVQATFIEFGERIVSFVGFCPQASYPALKGAFAMTADSFDSVINKRILGIQPARLKIVRASDEKQFREYLPERLPNGMDREDWAIKNQTELDKVISRGTKLKLPR
ncbi:MAG: M48 family metalloprotease [Verrucomicrobiota bacterium]